MDKFKTQILVDDELIPINSFIQRTMGNIVLGFLKSLKGNFDNPQKIEIKVEIQK